MADTSIKQVPVKPLSMEVYHRENFGLDIIDVRLKIMKSNIVTVHPKTAKDDRADDMKDRKKTVSIQCLCVQGWLNNE
ncbi:hypothetical protein KXD40_009204 [Peronospora effusa]|uniref:Uncharacterized protein n=1 Tax=Peronospora effusa TaxID=542832 RepID=A0A3M6VCB5_9STRA|nr:hypothetical protein DD238_008506 [Peronospora effusa]UIZ28541.1 hypothetical protein KXD40_009204 [Peronospora effusa]